MTPPSFDVAPDIRTDPPAAPGSASSRRAALSLTDPMRRRSFRLIFAALAAHGQQSREQLSETTGMKESSLCARLSELALWVETIDSAVIASSGCRVNGYRLNAVGLERWQRAHAAMGTE